MRKTINNFDEEELEILSALDKNLLKQSDTVFDDLTTAKNAALNTIGSFEEVRIELSVSDLHKLKKKAMQSGVSYQNLISILVHNYLDKFNIKVVAK